MTRTDCPSDCREGLQELWNASGEAGTLQQLSSVILIAWRNKKLASSLSLQAVFVLFKSTLGYYRRWSIFVVILIKKIVIVCNIIPFGFFVRSDLSEIPQQTGHAGGCSWSEGVVKRLRIEVLWEKLRKCIFSRKWLTFKTNGTIRKLYICRAWWRTKSGPKIDSVYMTCFHIAYSLCHILGALSYIIRKLSNKWSYQYQ
jgi:hypothetical protein